MRTLKAVALIAVVAGAVYAGPEPTNLAAVDTSPSRASVGLLWCTESDLTPNLLGSYHLGDYAGWGLYADVFGALDLSGGGAGVSADAPDQFPIIAPIRNALGADRAGVGLYYTTATHEVSGMLYIVTEF